MYVNMVVVISIRVMDDLAQSIKENMVYIKHPNSIQKILTGVTSQDGWYNGQEFCQNFGIRYEHVANYINKYTSSPLSRKKDKDERTGLDCWWLSKYGVVEFIVNCPKKDLKDLKEYICEVITLAI